MTLVVCDVTDICCAHAQVEEMLQQLEALSGGANVSVEHAEDGKPLPPASAQSFLKERPIPTVLLADHKEAFHNRCAGLVLTSHG